MVFKSIIVVFLLNLTSAVAAGEALSLYTIKNFICYYGAGNIEQLSLFDMIVLDPDNYERDQITQLKDKGKVLIGYVSVGEVERDRRYFSKVKQGWILGENPDWPDNFYVDVTKEGWHRILLDKVIPSVLEKGFHGICMDTLDTAELFPQLQQEMISLVGSIKKSFPKIIIIANNPLFIIDEIASYIDALLVEDVFSYYDFENKRYRTTHSLARERHLDKLISVEKKYAFPIFTLDYVKPRRKSLARKIYQMSRQYGFIPYVGTVDLQQVPKPVD